MAETSAPIRNVAAPAFEPNQVDVGTSPTLIVAARAGRRSALIINHGTFDVFLGGQAVSALTGLLLTGVKGFGLIVPTDVEIYGIALGGTQRVSYAELYGR